MKHEKKDIMNDKFKEIADRAGLYIDSSGRWANADGVSKFAQEIVKECSKYYSLSNYGIDTGKRIRQHFGLEDE